MRAPGPSADRRAPHTAPGAPSRERPRSWPTIDAATARPAPAASQARPAAPATAAKAAPAAPSGAPEVTNLTTSSSDDAPASAFAEAKATAPAPEAPATSSRAARRSGGRQHAAAQPKQETVVKDEWSKTPRNAPCPCGSGKKFKLCHGQ